MYQSQISRLKEDIVARQAFEGCFVRNHNFSGIQILGVRKVPSDINQGRHHLFIDLEDYRGMQYYCLLNGTLRYNFSKPLNEVACHIDIYGTNNSLQILGNGGFSQVIEGLSNSHTQYGHSSYYIYAVRTSDVVLPVESEQKRLIREIEERFKRLKEIIWEYGEFITQD